MDVIPRAWVMLCYLPSSHVDAVVYDFPFPPSFLTRFPKHPSDRAHVLFACKPRPAPFRSQYLVVVVARVGLFRPQGHTHRSRINMPSLH